MLGPGSAVGGRRPTQPQQRFTHQQLQQSPLHQQHHQLQQPQLSPQQSLQQLQHQQHSVPVAAVHLLHNRQPPPTLHAEDVIELLKRFNVETAAPTLESMRAAEVAAYEVIQQKEREDNERRNPSLRSIPKFYEKRPRDTEETNSLRPRVLRAAVITMLQRKTAEESLDAEDLHLVLSLLKKHSRDGTSDDGVIGYDGFAKIRAELAQRSDRFQQFFSPLTFMKFPRDQNGCIPITPFFMFLVRKVNIRQTRASLTYYDQLGCGYLREKDMENFIFELIPTLPQLQSLHEEFYPFYVFTAVRKFFFFLDPKRTGRVRIRDLASSPIMMDLNELRQERSLGASEAESNWFTMQSALKVYGAYLELDTDTNGMLSKSELKNYGSGMLTDVFIDRVFEEYQTYRDAETGEREMDYKTFLDFVLAMENKNTRQAIQYFWKLIDIHHTNCLDSFTINYFFRAIVRVLQTKNIDVPPVDDVKDEIFDMVKSEKPGIITMQDLINCRQGGTVLSMLIDAAAFWRYDHRESLLMEPDDDDDMKF